MPAHLTTDRCISVRHDGARMTPDFTERRAIEHEGQEVLPNTSIGIALSTPGYERPEDIMRDADTAMYRVKQSGRARFQVFDSSAVQGLAQGA